MAVPDFDTSRNRECMECHRAGFDEGDWQFMGYNDEAELYICPDCQSSAMADDGDVQTRVAEQRDAPVHAEQKCPLCKGRGWLRFQLGWGKCYHCNGTGISNRSAGG